MISVKSKKKGIFCHIIYILRALFDAVDDHVLDHELLREDNLNGHPHSRLGVAGPGEDPLHPRTKVLPHWHPRDPGLAHHRHAVLLKADV